MTTDSGPLRAVIYTRVSSDRDGAGRSVGEQEAECREECARRGWTVERVLTDNSFSATRWAKRDRPAYAELARVLASGGVDVLVTWEASRAQRDLTVYAALRDLSARHGVRWSYSGRLYDMGDDDDRFSTGVDALVGEREAGLTRKRIVRSVEARAARGGAHGRLPDGYAVEYDQTTGKASRRVLDPVRAPLIREAAERVLAGESAWSVASDFNARGLRSRSGRPWTGGNVLKRLRTPTLCGRRVYRGEVLEDVRGDWPPILTEEEYDRLQALLADPARRTSRGGNRVRWLGTGIHLCGVCGSPVRMLTRARVNGPRQVRYGCAASHCVQRSAELVDAKVEAVVTRFLARPDVVAELRDDDPGEAVREAQTEVARLRAELDDARRKVADGALTLDDLAFLRTQWEPKLAAAEARARPAWVPDAVYDVAGPEAAERWAATPVVRQRAILKALFVVRIMPTTVRDGSFDADAIVVERRELERRAPASPEVESVDVPPFAPELVTDRPPHFEESV